MSIERRRVLLLTGAGEGSVLPALNRDGDRLNGLIPQMVPVHRRLRSALLGSDDAWNMRVVMADAPPLLFGKDVANPMVMLLAGASLPPNLSDQTATVWRAISKSVFDAVARVCGRHIFGGRAATTDFTDGVIRRVRAKLAG